MTKENAQRTRYVVGDFLATTLAWFIFNIIRYYNIVEPGHDGETIQEFFGYINVALGQVLFPMMMVGIYYLSGFYNTPFYKSRIEETLSTLSSSLVGTITIFFIAIINDPIPDRISNYELVLMLWGLLFVIVWITRLCITAYGLKKIKRRDWKFPTLIVGEPKPVSMLYRRLTASERNDGYEIVGIINPAAVTKTVRPADADNSYPGNVKVYPIAEIDRICREKGVKNLIVATDNRSGEGTFALLNKLFSLELPILISPSVFHLITGKQKLRNVAGEPLVDISAPSMSQSTVNLKRWGDALVAGISLVVFSPLLLAIALAVKLDSRGPVLYRQERIGYHKKPFKILKFRTMRIDAEADGPHLSKGDDPRITRAGRFLRKYRLDELPQFWNVLVGDMSIVGPRPEREFYIRQIIDRAPYYTMIHQVRPGITSWGMVRYGYASDVDGMIDRLQYDLLYIANVSLLVDLKILAYTVNTVLTGKGI